MLVSEDLDETLTATEAAEEFAVHASTIRRWRTMGYIEVHRYELRYGRLVPVYKRGDIALAERDTRHRALNKRATGAVRSRP